MSRYENKTLLQKHFLLMEAVIRYDQATEADKSQIAKEVEEIATAFRDHAAKHPLFVALNALVSESAVG